MNNKNPSAEKKQIIYYYWREFPTSQQLWLHSPIGDGGVERKQISSFIFGLFNSKKFLHESSYDEYTLLKQKTGASTDFISNIRNVGIIIIIVIIIIIMIIIIVMMRMITKLVSTKN